jgi:SAM-dependent methyltransferase
MNPRAFFDGQHGSDTTPPLHYRLLRRFERPRLAAAAALLPGGRVLLDVGCGDGALAHALADRYARVVATDIAPSAIAEARGRAAAANVAFTELDANLPLPYPDRAFDAVVALSTLQYLFDPEAFLAEARRVLAPRGTLVIEVPNMAYLPQRLRLLAGRPLRTSYWPRGIDGGNLHYFTAGLLRALITRAGFVVDHVTGSGVFAPLRTWRPSLLCGNVMVRARR